MYSWSKCKSRVVPDLHKSTIWRLSVAGGTGREKTRYAIQYDEINEGVRDKFNTEWVRGIVSLAIQYLLCVSPGF